MKDKRSHEFDPDLLKSIPLDKREEFKTIMRKKRYMASGLFFFLWNMTLFYLSLPMVLFLWWLFNPLKEFWSQLFEGPIIRVLLFNFLFSICLSFSLKRIKESLNQIGLNVIHAVFSTSTILIVVFYLLVKK